VRCRLDGTNKSRDWQARPRHQGHLVTDRQVLGGGSRALRADGGQRPISFLTGKASVAGPDARETYFPQALAAGMRRT